MQKKLASLIVIFLFSFTVLSTDVQAGIKIWPGTINIEITEWNKKIEEKSTSIQVSNPYDIGINVTVKIEKPSSVVVEDGFIVIPETSWIEIIPDRFYIPAKSSETYIVTIKIPEDQYDLHYNEKWDARAVFTSDTNLESGGMQFQIELAVKLSIKTPIREAERSQYNPFLIIFILIGASVFLYYVYFRKKNIKSKSVFYFRKEKKN